MVRRIDQLKAESSTVFTGTYLYKWSVAMLQYFVKVQVLLSSNGNVGNTRNSIGIREQGDIAMESEYSSQ